METIIFHIDVNSAYLSWSSLKNLAEGNKIDLRTIPAMIGGDMERRHGVVLAKSIPAKKYGITTGEPIINAMRKCPSLVVEAPDHTLYHEKSLLLMNHLSEICPEIEQLSVDECFMDFTPIQNRFSSPEEAARIIKDQIRDTFGFTVNLPTSHRSFTPVPVSCLTNCGTANPSVSSVSAPPNWQIFLHPHSFPCLICHLKV